MTTQYWKDMIYLLVSRIFISTSVQFVLYSTQAMQQIRHIYLHPDKYSVALFITTRDPLPIYHILRGDSTPLTPPPLAPSSFLPTSFPLLGCSNLPHVFRKFNPPGSRTDHTFCLQHSIYSRLLELNLNITSSVSFL